VTEATEALFADQTEDGATHDRTEAAVAAFRRQLEGQVSVSATMVQDGLLEVWGTLPEGDLRSVVESWLTETLQRNLYAVTDVDARLESVFSSAKA
jgi:hypothetical protein